MQKYLNKNHQICCVCYKAKSVYIPSGDKVIDDFIKHTLISGNKLLVTNVKFIAEGGLVKFIRLFGLMTQK
jgi:hypothetical protein